MNLTTHLYSVTIPEVFEKVLQMGKLLRCEKMDKLPDEGCFAEVNFFVGPGGDFGLDEADDETTIEAFWQDYLSTECEGTDGWDDSIVFCERQPKQLDSLLRLAANEWRPEVEQQMRFLCLAGEGAPVYAKYVLEYDAKFRSLYEVVSREFLDSLRWTNPLISSAALEQQSTQVFSSFDKMDENKRREIAERYRELTFIPKTPSIPRENPVWDLTGSNSLDPDALKNLPFTPSEETTVTLLVPGFPAPIKYTRHGHPEGFIERDFQLIADLATLSQQQLDKAAEMLWQHCQECFEQIDYGAGEESNESFFDIHNSSQAWEQSGPGLIWNSEEDAELVNRLCILQFYPPWESEHGCGLVLRNGEFLACVDYADLSKYDVK